MPPTFHIAHEPLYLGNFKGTPKVELLSIVWRPAPFKVRTSQKFPTFWVIIKLFFYKILFPGQTVNFSYSMSYIFRNLICFSGQFELFWNIFSAYCNASDLLTPTGWYVNFFLQCFLGGIWWLWNMKLREIHLTYTYWPPRILCPSDGFCPDDK